MKYNQKLISASVIASSLIVSGYIIAGAQTVSTDTVQTQPAATTTTAAPATSTPPQITFPIPELGNCANQNDCKTYCDVSANQQACLSFAQAHGLMRAEEVSRAKKMLQLTQSGQTPGGCTTKDSCESYCSASAHASECISFAEKNGLIQGKDLEDAKKILPLLQSGQTPGGCTSKDACEAYCSDSSHAAECVNFAEKAGLISSQEADMARKTGGKGPGGCTSEESCNTFCNQKENQQACFNFAKENNLIPADQLQQIQEGTARLRVGLSQMPGDVVQCLKDKLGSDAVGQIESGQLVPNKDIGDTIQGCFNEFKPQMAAKIQEGLKNATPEVTACLQSSLSADEFQKMQQGQISTPELGDKVKNCFEKMKESAKPQMEAGLQQLNNLPQQAKDCVAQKLGSDFFSNLQSGNTEALKNTSQDQIKSAVESCVSQMQGGPASGTFPGGINTERFKEIMQQQGASGTSQGAPTSEQIKQMMEKQGIKVPERINGEGGANTSAGPTPEQIKEMMQRGGQGVPGNIPTGPTPQQIQNMMQGQIPQGIPQTAVPPQGAIPQQPQD